MVNLGRKLGKLQTNAIVYGQIPTHGVQNLPHYFRTLCDLISMWISEAIQHQAGQDGDGEQGGEERRDGEQGRAVEVVQQEVEGRRAQPGRQLQRHRQDLQVSSFATYFILYSPK